MTELVLVSDSSNCSSSSSAAAAVAASSSLPSQVLFERLKDYGQQDALSLWNELSREEQDLLIKDIEDLQRIDRIIRCSLLSQGLSTPTIEPVPGTSVSSVEERTLEERGRWWKMGLKAISEGKLAVILLSGGQEQLAGISDWDDGNCKVYVESNCGGIYAGMQLQTFNAKSLL